MHRPFKGHDLCCIVKCFFRSQLTNTAYQQLDTSKMDNVRNLLHKSASASPAFCLQNGMSSFIYIYTCALFSSSRQRSSIRSGMTGYQKEQIRYPRYNKLSRKVGYRNREKKARPYIPHVRDRKSATSLFSQVLTLIRKTDAA